MIILAPISLQSQGVLKASFSFFWSCRGWRDRYEGSSRCMGLLRLSPMQSPVSLGCSVAFPPQPHVWVGRVVPQGTIPPQSLTTGWAMPQPTPVIPPQPLLRDFDAFETICKFMWFLMVLMCVLKCSVFQPKYEVHCSLATSFSLPCRSWIMPFASRLFRRPRLKQKGKKPIFFFVETRLRCFFIIYIVRHTTVFLRGASPVGTGIPRAAQGTRQQQAEWGI